MKLDQETVVKHQFWFLLGGYFVLWLTAVLWMKFSFPSEIEDLKKKYDGAAGGVKTALSSGPVNVGSFLPPWDNETKEFSQHKGVIWGDAWHVQEEMYDWPAEWVKKYSGLKTPQAQISPDDRNDYKEKLYPNQIKNLRTNMPKILNPVELKDGFDNIFQPKKDWREIPTREEIWLAQEDFWVKRELLYVVYWCVAQQAVMEPVEIDEKKESMPKGVEARQRYRNKNWEITLNLRKSNEGLVIGGDSTIKNIHPSHQPQALTSAKGQGIWFNIGQDAIRTTFEVRGEPIGWNETKNFSEENYRDPLSGFKWDKDYLKEHPIFVSQGFDQTNCPIRRINAMELSKQDCRTFIWPLQPNHLLAALDALPEDQDPAKKAADSSAPPSGAGGSTSSNPAAMMAMMTGSSGRPGGAGGAAAPAANLTPNNDIERDRYLQPTEMDKKLNPPSHHLPLAIQLIVEQAHMHDIMLALANSRLRFQITQVEFRHEKDYVPQSDSDKDKKDGQDTRTPKMFTGNMSTMMGGMARGSSMGPGRPGGSGRGSSSMRGGPPMGGGSMRGGPPMGGGSMRGGASGNPMMMMMMMQQSGGAMGGGPMQPKFNRAPGAMSGTVPTAAGTDPNQAAANQTDDNLVELTIYGISTLYREPDAPQTTAPAGQSGTPAQQQAAPAAPASGAATPSTTTAQPGGATQPQAGSTPPNGGSPTQASPKQPSGDASAPKATTPPPSDGAPTPPKQPDKNVEQQKAPPPPPPPADKKR